MKNKKNTKITYLMSFLSILISSSECFAENLAGSNVIPFKTILVKFGITMGAVLLSILLIWAALISFKQYVNSSFKNNGKTTSLNEKAGTPKNIDEAVRSFIDKNRV